MARQEKPIQLKTVDEAPPSPDEVVRLTDPSAPPKLTVVNPTPAGKVRPSERRLSVPAKDDVELRTHEPDIETLVEADLAILDQEEAQWGGQTEENKPVPWGWFVLVGIAILAAIAWSTRKVDKAEQKVEQIRQETALSLTEDEREIEEATILIEKISRRLEQFCAAASPEDLLPHIRQPERVRPLIQDYYKRHPYQPSPLEEIVSLDPLTLNNQGIYWLAAIKRENGEEHTAIIESPRSAEPLIDWETLVAYQPMDWDTFARERPRDVSMDFRVHAKRDFLYSHEFSEAAEWICVQLEARDSIEPLFGYAPAQSEIAGQIVKLVESNRFRPTAMILRLRVPKDLKSPQGVLIEEVICPRWIHLDSPVQKP